MQKRSTELLPASAATLLPTIDRQIARAFASQIAERHRLTFAQSFTFAVMQACRQASIIPHKLPKPAGIELLTLTAEALKAANQLGEGLAHLEPRFAAYLAGIVYTTALPEAYRATHGIFYTPPPLVDRLLTMIESEGIDWKTARVLDPAAGGGAFLIPAALRMAAALKSAEPAFVLQQIGVRLRGFELDPFGAWLAQVSLEHVLQDVITKAGRPAPSMIELKDSLDMGEKDDAAFDLVIGNPPYGRVTPSVVRRAYFKRSTYGHANLYGLFTDAALHWVKEGGLVGYVTPTSMLSGLYFKALRGLLAGSAPPRAINFVSERNGVFADALQETMLATYRRETGKRRAGKVGFIDIEATGETRFRSAGTFTLPKDATAPWLLPRASDQVALTRNLRAMPHRLADYGYAVSTGPLVWNRFKDQFRRDPTADCLPVIWAESVTSAGRFVWRSEKRNHAPWFAPKPRDGWLVVTEPCVLLQRTTAKEQHRRLIAAEMPASFLRQHGGGVIVENHLNMIRATRARPKVSGKVIAALLNSAPVDAAFRCINGSVAVSAFELEGLPLPAPPVMAKLAALVAAGASTKKIEALIAAAYARADAAAAS